MVVAALHARATPTVDLSSPLGGGEPSLFGDDVVHAGQRVAAT